MLIRMLALLGALALCACHDQARSNVDGGGDLAQATTACGGSCRSNQVCVHPQCAPCVSPTDGGTCPDGFMSGNCPTAGPSCVGAYQDVYMDSCAELKSGCHSTNLCDCLATPLVACETLDDHNVATLCY